jgi:hypothetical protein
VVKTAESLCQMFFLKIDPLEGLVRVIAVST